MDEIHNYNILASTEEEKALVIELIRRTGGEFTAISGYGRAFYIQFKSTPYKVAIMNKALSESRVTA